MTNGSLEKVKSIAECSHRSEKPFFCVRFEWRLRQILLYISELWPFVIIFAYNLHSCTCYKSLKTQSGRYIEHRDEQSSIPNLIVMSPLS